MKKKNNSLINKFLSFSVGSWVTFIIGIFSTPLITNLFSPDQYGIFSKFEMYASLVMLVILFGIDQSFVRFFYTEKEENRKALLFKCLKIPTIVNIIAVIIVVLFRNKLSNFIFGETTVWFALIAVLHLSFLTINKFALMVVRMQQKSKTYSFLIVLNKVAYISMVIIAAFFLKNNYMALVIALLTSNIIVTVIAMACEHNYWNIFEIKKDHVECNTSTKEIFYYGAPLVFTNAVYYIFQSADKLSIDHYWGVTQMGLYSAAARIVALLTILQGCFTTFWVPVAFERYEKNHEDTAFFEKANLIVTIAMFFCAIGLLLFRDILALFLGPEYRVAAFIVPFLSFMPIMYTVSETTVLGINFKKKQKQHIYISIISCLVNVIGNAILVPKLQAVGAGISTGLSYIVFFSLRTHISSKYFKVNYHLKKFYTMTFALCLYALYATLFRFNFLYVVFGICELIVLYVLYRKYINEMFALAKNKISQLKSK